MCLLQFTFLLVDCLVDNLALCVKLSVIDGGATFLVRRLIRRLALLLHNCVVPDKLSRLGLEPSASLSLMSSLRLAFLLVDRIKCSGARILVDRLVHNLALVVVDCLILGRTHLINRLRGAFKIDFWKNLGIWPNQRTPSPPPRKLGRQKKTKKVLCLFCISGYSKHIIFS